MKFLSFFIIGLFVVGSCFAQTSTPTMTPTNTPTRTPTITPTVTNTPTITSTPTITPYPDFKVTYDFVPGTDIQAYEMNTNFGDCETAISNIVGKWIVDHTITEDDLSRSTDVGGACVAHDNIQDQAVRAKHIYSDIAGDALGWDNGVLKVNADEETLTIVGDSIAVKSGGITSDQIDDNAIKDEDIQEVSGEKLSYNTVTLDKLTAAGEPEDYIAAVTSEGTVEWKALGNIGLGDDAVSAANIVEGAVTTSKLGSDLKAGSGWGLVPVGAEMGWPVATPPAGWLIENGQPVSRTTYATLFAVIGTTYGAGNGATTFNLPNYVNRVAIGSGDAYALASTGGASTHTHTGSSHVHTVAPHQHAVGTGYDSLGSCWIRGLDPGNIYGEVYRTNVWLRQLSYTDSAHYGNMREALTQSVSLTTDTGGTGSTGSSSSLPPYLSAYRIIKY